MVGLTIRPLTADDKPAWRALWTAYLEFYETQLPEEVFETTFTRLLGDDPQDFTCLLAEFEGRPVGLVHFLYHRHNWKVENVCYLQDLFAVPDLRGKGIGRALIEAVYQAAEENGTPTVYWLTQDFNTSARQLYDRIAEKTPFIKYQN
ncbi:MAG: GNAT family N-acetyltransferase [Halocynthiibacter sp.]